MGYSPKLADQVFDYFDVNIGDRDPSDVIARIIELSESSVWNDCWKLSFYGDVTFEDAFAAVKGKGLDTWKLDEGCLEAVSYAPVVTDKKCVKRHVLRIGLKSEPSHFMTVEGSGFTPLSKEISKRFSAL